jgi:hypothetical protein
MMEPMGTPRLEQSQTASAGWGAKQREPHGRGALRQALTLEAPGSGGAVLRTALLQKGLPARRRHRADAAGAVTAPEPLPELLPI